MSSSATVEAGQRWTSTTGGPAVIVLEKSNHGDDTCWLVKSEGDGVMTTIHEWRLLDDYELAHDDSS